MVLKMQIMGREVNMQRAFQKSAYKTARKGKFKCKTFAMLSKATMGPQGGAEACVSRSGSDGILLRKLRH